MAEQKSNKPRISGEDLRDLEELSASIKDIPDPEMRRIAKEELQGLMQEAMSVYDFGIAPLAIEKPMVDALAWIPNTIQTVAGEGLVAAKRAANQEPQQLKEAAKNIGNAVVPFGEPGPAISEYRKELGGTGENFDKKYLPENKYFNPTVGGTLDFGVGVLTDPSVWSAIKNPAALAKSGMTADELREGLKAAIQAQKSKSVIRKGAEAAGKVALNPLEELGKILYRNRFKNADAAAAASGARPFSDVMMEAGAPGITSKGIQENVKELIANKEGAIDKIHNIPNAPTSLRSEVLAPLGSPELQRVIEQPGKTTAYQAAKEDILQEFRDSALANPSLAERYDAAKGLAGKPNFNPETGEHVYEVAPPKDVLQFVDESYSPKQLRETARTYQQKAASSGFYSKPTVFDVKNKTQLKQLYENQALADLQNRIGANARELEIRNLDAAAPGAGGQVFQEYKDIHSLLSGSPFIDRSFKGLSATPSSRANYWIGRQNPVIGAAMDIGQGAKNVLQTGAAKGLMSRPSKYIASPLLRTYVPNEYYEDYRNSPWSLMKQYGVEK